MDTTNNEFKLKQLGRNTTFSGLCICYRCDDCVCMCATSGCVHLLGGYRLAFQTMLHVQMKDTIYWPSPSISLDGRMSHCLSALRMCAVMYVIGLGIIDTVHRNYIALLFRGRQHYCTGRILPHHSKNGVIIFFRASNARLF